MANIEQRLTQFMVQEHCFRCGVEFWMPHSIYTTARRDTKHEFFCPNGHGQGYSVSDAERLEKERDTLKVRLDFRDSTIESQRAEIDKLARKVSRLTKKAKR